MKNENREELIHNLNVCKTMLKETKYYLSKCSYINVSYRNRLVMDRNYYKSQVRDFETELKQLENK